ncbi:TetR/AcrR family transcriptional regulator [Nioella ostreopsis]|uniref:TetR/AcrR family transcriptional regulator n=1 Tax=Nioella ostreopsis TaxID=2448479 RepID=UPI000FD7BE7E|nr:TetR/AcrR family transcriptional regulator [Nioella ostreopsis]
MREEAREARAAQIEDAAYRVLDAKGFEGLSMLAVAKEAKASNETLYRWYGDKTGLFAALITRNTEIVRATMKGTRTEDPMAELAALGPALLTMLTGPRAVALNRAAAADKTGTLGQTLGKAGRERVFPWIIGVMDRACAAGQLAGSPGDIAETYLSLLVGDWQVRRVTGAMPPPSADQIDARARVALTRLTALFQG